MFILPKLVGAIMLLLFIASPVVAPIFYYPDDTSLTIIQEMAVKANYVAYTPTGTVIYRITTGYSSTPDQTDSTPFITAYNTKVRRGIVASNEFPKGTRLMIDGYIYIVEDKTHPRYRYLIDIWFPTREEAKNWGRQLKEIILLN